MKIKETFVSFIGEINVGKLAFFIDADKKGIETDINIIVDKAKHFSRVVLLNDPLHDREELAIFVKKLVKLNFNTVIEINTYGLTKPIGLSTYNIIFNIIVQLKNTGIDYANRINKNALNWFNDAESNFLFYVEDENCVDEVNLLVTDVGIRKNKIYLAAKGEATTEKLKLLIKCAKMYNYNFSLDYRNTFWPKLGRF